jgi:putative endonuclease
LSKSTKKYLPWEIIYYEEFERRSEAMRREKELKSHKGREFIREFVLNGGVRQLPD